MHITRENEREREQKNVFRILIDLLLIDVFA